MYFDMNKKYSYSLQMVHYSVWQCDTWFHIFQTEEFDGLFWLLLDLVFFFQQYFNK